MHITCNIRVDRASYPHLEAGLGTVLQPERRNDLTGLPKGTLYRPADRMLKDQQGLNEHTLQLGSLKLSVQLGHLLSSGQAAIVAASPGYRQYAVAPLLATLGEPMAPDAQQQWWTNFKDIMKRGPQLGLQLQTAVPGTAPVRWLREETRLVRSDRDWFVVLGFELSVIRRLPAKRPGAGLDLGLLTLATAAIGTDVATARRGAQPDWAYGSVDREVQSYRALYDSLQYAAARTSLEQLGEQLVAEAAFVATEELNWQSFRSRFPAEARRLAVIDWGWSTLPQLLYAHGIPLVRVDPRNSSRECHACHSCRPGQRWRHRFACRNPACCLVMDADLNAARVIGQRGAAALHRRM